ncbi:MAG: UDP-N-acetylmuramate dehydrogenase [Acidimicrobiia bacterium]|nr:UDP-N-acetylmuramate dehydrogenase [Acidimicrobiia bacterium]MYC45220.1 UDP-N-acetylmuramate dehydrogenase [Acidimicrobiia bacterium]
MTEPHPPATAGDWSVAARHLASALPESRVTGGAPLGALSTYRVGGAAAVLVEVGSLNDLRRLAQAVAQEGWGVLVVGLGSNLLVADAGFDGVALRLGAAFAVTRIDAPAVTAGGATPLPVVARQCAAAALGGFGWAVGVPGSVGGAVRMNAGGHGSDMSEVLERAEIVDLATGGEWRAGPQDLALGYRRSALTFSHVVAEVEIRLQPSRRDREEQLIREVVAWRRRHQPGGANAGSVFMNPPGDSAGRLVDAAGCKGLRIGSACVSTLHANFIQADTGGSADDVMSLMAEVARRVEAHSGVRLQPETHFVGFEKPFGSQS